MNRSRSAFTLMEMLVVIALIATLMTIGGAGMRVANDMARKAQTRTTIMKLNQVVMEKYAAYQYRRISVGQKSTVQLTEDARLKKLYQTMIYEMPDHWDEVSTYSAYRLKAAKQHAGNKNSELQSAELLYQIVMAIPDADTEFNSSEIADTDGNGLKEFVDAWGHPIQFIRWPAGHYHNHGEVISKLQLSNDYTKYPCPFVSALLPNGTSQNYSNVYFVIPLIFSCGPDGESGIDQSQSGLNPCANTTAGSLTNASEYYDNITNHNL